jgi:hypothetical protein
MPEISKILEPYLRESHQIFAKLLQWLEANRLPGGDNYIYSGGVSALLHMEARLQQHCMLGTHQTPHIHEGSLRQTLQGLRDKLNRLQRLYIQRGTTIFPPEWNQAIQHIEAMENKL